MNHIKAPPTKTDTTNKPILLRDINSKILQYLSRATCKVIQILNVFEKWKESSVSQNPTQN